MPTKQQQTVSKEQQVLIPGQQSPNRLQSPATLCPDPIIGGAGKESPINKKLTTADSSVVEDQVATLPLQPPTSM